jgi:hypothetical protein
MNNEGNIMQLSSRPLTCGKQTWHNLAVLPTIASVFGLDYNEAAMK